MLNDPFLWFPIGVWAISVLGTLWWWRYKLPKVPSGQFHDHPDSNIFLGGMLPMCILLPIMLVACAWMSSKTEKEPVKCGCSVCSCKGE